MHLASRRTELCSRGMSQAFTMVELLVVVSIVSIGFAIAMSIPKQDKRRVAVESAANELAATMRLARGMAMQRQAMYAVVFNISNGKGTSGKALNNWDGGHWYRIIGPQMDGFLSENVGLPMHPEPVLPNPGSFTNRNDTVPIFLRRVRQSWVGDTKRLPVKKVRFLALTDQDNGHVHHHLDTSTSASQFNAYPASYPRPWCGYWNGGKLTAWGGYDPTAVDATGRSNSAFYFDGLQPPVNSVNTTDRYSTTVWSEVSSSAAGTADAANSTLIFKTGEVRPVVNGEWMDYYISFRPDGTVAGSNFGRLRWESQFTYGNRDSTTPGNGQFDNGGLATPRGDIGDMFQPMPLGAGTPPPCIFPAPYKTIFPNKPPDILSPLEAGAELASSYQSRTGYWYVTLAPDIEADTDQYPTAMEAWRSLTPAVRVGVNQVGDVQVRPVLPFLQDPYRNTDLARVNYDSQGPVGALGSLDTSIAATDAAWSNAANTNVRYPYGMLVYPDGSEGRPIVNCLTPNMLSQRSWWWNQ